MLREVPRRLRGLGITRWGVGPRFVLLAIILVLAVPAARAEESLGTKIKRIFEPTPPPKKKKASTTSKKSPSPTPLPSKKKDSSPTPAATPKETPTPSSTPEASSSPKNSPSPSRKGKGKKKVSPSPTPSPTPSLTPSPTPSVTPEKTSGATASPKGSNSPGASLAADQISGIENYAPAVRKLIDMGLGLTSQNLTYKYGSADPLTGGLDCSGFVYYTLRQNGVKDVPRDASSQYAWLRKTGEFRAVISRSEDTFELDELKPGDLLFWTGTYGVQKDPPITHAMIYLGREKKTNARIMVGASDGRTFHGESRFGVGVFDFRISRPGGAREGRTPTFVGYGKIPGLGDG